MSTLKVLFSKSSLEAWLTKLINSPLVNSTPLTWYVGTGGIGIFWFKSGSNEVLLLKSILAEGVPWFVAGGDSYCDESLIASKEASHNSCFLFPLLASFSNNSCTLGLFGLPNNQLP